MLLLGGYPALLAKAAGCGLEVVNVQKPEVYYREAEEICAEVHVLNYQDVAAITAGASPVTGNVLRDYLTDLFPILAETPPDSRGEIQLTNGLRTLRGRRPIYAVEFEGQRHDTGEKLGFLKATVDFALARPDLADAFRAYLKSLPL